MAVTATEHQSFSRICQVAPICNVPHVVSWAHGNFSPNGILVVKFTTETCLVGYMFCLC